MKIVVAAPILNEEYHIREFCERHSFADKIILSDGGSTDNTLAIAAEFPNVQVRHFKTRLKILTNPPTFMNPEGVHFNHCIFLAYAENPDWVIFGQADQYPNKELARDIRSILEKTTAAGVSTFRLNLWGRDQYFPKMMKPDWRVIWAWRGNQRICFSDDPYHVKMLNIPRQTRILNPPYTLIHNFCATPEIVEKKLARYKSWGVPQVHPLKWTYAPPVPLPSWAKEW